MSISGTKRAHTQFNTHTYINKVYIYQGCELRAFNTNVNKWDKTSLKLIFSGLQISNRNLYGHILVSKTKMEICRPEKILTIMKFAP